MTEVGIKQANDAFGKQVTAQVARITGELSRLEQLLSAGMVDRRVVAEFRDAVEKVSKTSWLVQCWMDGDLHDLASSMIAERIHAASQLANHLASDLQSSTSKFAGLPSLRESINKLEQVLAEGGS